MKRAHAGEAVALQRVTGFRRLFSRRRIEQHRRKMERAFRESHWPLYGLPTGSACRRFLGGWGRTDSRTSSLELGHLRPDGSLAAQLRVEVRTVDVATAELEEDLAVDLWMGSRPRGLPTETFFERLEELEGADGRDSPIHWQPWPLVIDAQPVVFQKAEVGEYWTAFAEARSLAIVVTGQSWPSDRLELVTIEDLEPYVEGSRRSWNESRDNGT